MDRENDLRKDEMNISLALPFVLILINHIDLMITVIISRINIKDLVASAFMESGS